MLRNHAPLQSLSGGRGAEAKLFPNVILLLVKATEKRFEGENSNLTKVSFDLEYLLLYEFFFT